jgi:hypothetical protein
MNRYGTNPIFPEKIEDAKNTLKKLKKPLTQQAIVSLVTKSKTKH